MSVKCICIDDKQKPSIIPDNRWLKEGKEYTILFTTLVMPQKVVGVHLAEVELTAKESPYEFYLLSRFAFSKDEIIKLAQLIKDCNETHFEIGELLEQTKLEEA